MGFHLPGPTKGKVEHLIATYGAARISKPPEAFHDIPESKALICVVDTVTYETATYCYSAVEMTLLNETTRWTRTWSVTVKLGLAPVRMASIAAAGTPASTASGACACHS
jgi:hypothetical protein